MFIYHLITHSNQQRFTIMLTLHIISIIREFIIPTLLFPTLLSSQLIKSELLKSERLKSEVHCVGSWLNDELVALVIHQFFAGLVYWIHIYIYICFCKASHHI